MFATAVAESINNASLSGCDAVARDLWKRLRRRGASTTRRRGPGRRPGSPQGGLARQGRERAGASPKASPRPSYAFPAATQAGVARSRPIASAPPHPRRLRADAAGARRQVHHRRARGARHRRRRGARAWRLRPLARRACRPRRLLPQPRPTARLVGIAARILGVVAISLLRAARRRRDARLLSTMDDYLLHDIGVVRSDIARAVRLGRGGLL